MKKPGAAEDIVVDIFASFWERRETLQIQITLKAYLFQSARNRALNYLRDNERFISTDDFSSLERFENDETLETQELQRLIHEAIFSLPPKCRDVFNKSRMDNLSNKEIAEQMNISVKSRGRAYFQSVKNRSGPIWGMPITTYGDFISTRLKKIMKTM